MSLYYFADKEDLTRLFEEFERKADVQYFIAASKDSPTVPFVSSILSLPDLGTVAFGDWNRTAIYLVGYKGLKIESREILQYNGQLRYTVDQALNPDTIVLKLSGVFEQNILVAGSIATISNTTSSKLMYNSLKRIIDRNSEKIDSCYVCPGAAKKLDADWRLVTNHRSPTGYDIKRR